MVSFVCALLLHVKWLLMLWEETRESDICIINTCELLVWS